MNQKNLEKLYDEYSQRQREADHAETFYDIAFTLFVISLFIVIVYFCRSEIKAFSKTFPTTTTEQHNTITK